MGDITKSTLLNVSEKEILQIRELVNLGNETTINEDIDMVLDWFEKQQHLPRIQLDRRIVERILVSRKGSVEQTKHKIDMMFTIRTLIPELAAPRDVLHPDLQRQFEGMVYATLPKLNHDLTRISVIEVTKDISKFDLADGVKYILSTIEYRYRYDYCAGERYILDYQHATLGVLAKTNPIICKKFEIILRKGYGTRIAGIHFINGPSFLGKIIAIFKAALSDKLGSRIQVHPTYEDLHKHISKSSLPCDFGGDGGPLKTCAEQWKQELSKEDNRKFLKEQETLRSDEALRAGARESDDMLGIPGSFKKIEID